jgi:hypothetical protein
MKRGLQRTGVSAGFTIVETMIVLAVTGILFVTIVVTWTGRQHKNEFSTASNEIRSRIQQVITDVQNGRFPDKANFSCSSGGVNLALGSGAQAQGTNVNCVYLGKVMQFGYKNSNPEQFRVFSVAGLRNQTDFADQRATVLAAATQNLNMNNDLVEAGNLLYGLSVSQMKVLDAGTWKNVMAVGFLSRNGSKDQLGNMNSGNQQIDLYAVDGDVTTVDTSGTKPADRLNSSLATGSPKYYVNEPVKICFKSGGTDQYALVTLGTDNRQLSPEMQVVNACG